ncbi:hypothetical protein EXIGLDRAFT_600125 [Exidia glandulosa HHB12029]|uniref:Vacuole protein n=1 Tax=Exidia glandulosa HHB12029 TaxID=1314781 RepID=A0A165R3M0_EXIGL|nr:hypothetical protein EXIGLDRAFT_600125 [Exidia glandulosa HHB12029]
MCQSGPKWKREVIPDHKFDFVDVRDFHTKSIGVRLRYFWLYILIIKSFLVYLSDIFTAITMLSSNQWSNQIFDSCPPTEENGCVFIPFETAKYLFLSCIGFSLLLLAYEARKSKKILASRDISYAFTNVMANNYYSLRSYDHFCFFCHINDSTKTLDNFAFFVFFTFKEWKRLLLADGPRQAINGLTLYSIYLSKEKDGPWDKFSKYSDNYVTTLLLISTLFTVIIFAGSLLILIVAAVCYIPLLCYIRGNLKEFCCHKVDKRISEIVKKKAKQRQQEQAELDRKEAMGDYSHLKGKSAGARLPQPTLPNVSVDDDDDDRTMYGAKSDYKSDYQSSVYSGRQGYGGGGGFDASEYPPMPMYNGGGPGYGGGYDDFDAPTRYGTPQPGVPPRIGTPQRTGTPQLDPYVDHRQRTPAPVQGLGYAEEDPYDGYGGQHQQHPSQPQQQQYGGGYGGQQQQYGGGGAYDQRGYGGGAY